MSPHHTRLDRPSLRRGAVAAGVTLLALWAAVAALTPTKTANSTSTNSSGRRVAVRVDCGASDCALAEALALDVWSEERAVGGPFDIVVDEAGLAQLQTAGAALTVLDNDIDATAEAEHARLSAASTSTTSMTAADWFSEFRDYRAIEARLRELQEFAPERVSIEGIGATLDGRPIWALHLKGSEGATAERVPLLINGTEHAREWIAAMSATCIADRLVRNYATDDAVRAFVDSTDTWIVPVVNPDGYQYSWAQDRYWRKNRRGGFGVDLNRNFSVAWGDSGSSGSKRSDIYRGEAPFSEPESIALRALVKREGIRAHLDLHAYGQLVLFPWNHGSKPSADDKRFAAIGDDVASAIYAQHQNKYRLMRGAQLYPAAGTMTDWMYGDVGATSFTIELRPRSGTGFVLPPSEIKPTCDEAMAAVLALRASKHLR